MLTDCYECVRCGGLVELTIDSTFDDGGCTCLSRKLFPEFSGIAESKDYQQEIGFARMDEEELNGQSKKEDRGPENL